MGKCCKKKCKSSSCDCCRGSCNTCCKKQKVVIEKCCRTINTWSTNPFIGGSPSLTAFFLKQGCLINVMLTGSFTVSATGTTGSLVSSSSAIPCGYVPSANVVSVNGTILSTDGVTYYPLLITIGSNGSITIQPFPTLSFPAGPTYTFTLQNVSITYQKL